MQQEVTPNKVHAGTWVCADGVLLRPSPSLQRCVRRDVRLSRPRQGARSQSPLRPSCPIALCLLLCFWPRVVRDFVRPAVKISNLLKSRQILVWRTQGEYIRLINVDEGRKRVLLIAACILAARKLSQWDGRHSPASESAISDAIALAERILSKIDSHWPVRS